MASKHQLSLDIVQTSNCSVIRLFDTSIYTDDLDVDCATIQVVPPGFNETVSISVSQNFDFLLTACLLGIQTQNCSDQANYLPDGIYYIKYSVSPNDKVFVEYNYLRTCQILQKYYMELCKLELAACEPDADVKAQIAELQLIKAYIDAAKAKVEECNDLSSGIELLIYAKDRLDKFGRDGCCGPQIC